MRCKPGRYDSELLGDSRGANVSNRIARLWQISPVRMYFLGEFYIFMSESKPSPIRATTSPVPVSCPLTAGCLKYSPRYIIHRKLQILQPQPWTFGCYDPGPKRFCGALERSLDFRINDPEWMYLQLLSFLWRPELLGEIFTFR